MDDITVEELALVIQYLGDIKISDMKTDDEALVFASAYRKLKKDMKERMKF